jgi:hypothetical protein
MIRAVELDTLLEPLSLCLNAESARRLMAYHIDDSVHARIETLAERANEGSLNPEERAEYETLVNAADFIAILKLKARRRLDHTTHWDWTPQPDASFAKERDTAANTVCFTNGIGNLALACHHCNLRKGPNLSGIDPLTACMESLFHPRRDRWADHFPMRGAHIDGVTPRGRATAEVLAFNNARRLEPRQELQK